MKYYGDSVDFFVDVPNCWERCCRYPKDKTWYTNPEPKEPYKTINFYHDIEGSRIVNVTESDLCIYRPESRIKEDAFLPHYYAVGERFIKLQKSGPGGFDYPLFPMNLQEKLAMDKEIRKNKRKKKNLKKKKQNKTNQNKNKSQNDKKIKKEGEKNNKTIKRK